MKRWLAILVIILIFLAAIAILGLLSIDVILDGAKRTIQFSPAWSLALFKIKN